MIEISSQRCTSKQIIETIDLSNNQLHVEFFKSNREIFQCITPINLYLQNNDIYFLPTHLSPLRSIDLRKNKIAILDVSV